MYLCLQNMNTDQLIKVENLSLWRGICSLLGHKLSKLKMGGT